LGVTFEPNLKFDIHISNCVNKVQRILAMIRRSFDHMDKDMFLVLYKLKESFHFLDQSHKSIEVIL
jgi:hypothetical protein